MEIKISQELKDQDKILTDICEKYGKRSGQSRFTFLFKILKNNICNKEEKKLIWNTALNVQFLKGQHFYNKKEYLESKSDTPSKPKTQ